MESKNTCVLRCHLLYMEDFLYVYLGEDLHLEFHSSKCDPCRIAVQQRENQPSIAPIHQSLDLNFKVIVGKINDGPLLKYSQISSVHFFMHSCIFLA